MHDADEIKCLIFEVAIRNIVLGKVTKSGVSEANNKLIVNIFLTVWSYRPQPFMNRVKCWINILTLAVRCTLDFIWKKVTMCLQLQYLNMFQILLSSIQRITI